MSLNCRRFRQETTSQAKHRGEVWGTYHLQANLDGQAPCLVVNRGTYTTIRLAAYQFQRGRLEKLWAWDSREEAGRGRYRAQGAHILHAADVDGDGRDEIIVGSAVVDDSGL